MFILLVSRGVPSPKDPQWGCFEKDQAEALTALGHKVVVVSVDGRFRWYYRKLGISKTKINNIEYFDSFFIPFKFLRILGGWRFAYWVESIQLELLYRQIVQLYGKPDVVYAHYLGNSYISLRLKQKYCIPMVAIEHWSEVGKDNLKPYVRGLGTVVYNNVDKLIVVSESLKRRIEQHFKVDSLVIHNMIGREFAASRNSNVILGKMQFVATGSLIYGKGFDLLIAAFAKLMLPMNEWELCIIGNGKEKNSLQKQIHSAKLEGNIRLVGRKNKVEIANILSQSNIFVLPSRGENFSVAVLEALACGLPVIASICGGIRECIEDFNGLLFPVDDVDALADAIKYMFEHYDQYDRKRIAEDCKNRFSPKVIAQQLTHVFEQTIEEYKEKNK